LKNTSGFIANAMTFKIASVLMRAAPPSRCGYDQPLSSRDVEAGEDLRQETKEEEDDAQTAHQ
jgi:hypothetical protein